MYDEEFIGRPAIVEDWRLPDMEHAGPDHPTTVIRDPDTGTVLAYYFMNDKGLHAVDGPAEAQFYEDGSKKSEQWCRDGQPHRVGGPAIIEYSVHGVLVSEQHVLNGRLHREQGPALIERDPTDGTVTKQAWFKADVEHPPPSGPGDPLP